MATQTPVVHKQLLTLSPIKWTVWMLKWVKVYSKEYAVSCGTNIMWFTHGWLHRHLLCINNYSLSLQLNGHGHSYTDISQESSLLAMACLVVRTHGLLFSSCPPQRISLILWPCSQSRLSTIHRWTGSQLMHTCREKREEGVERVLEREREREGIDRRSRGKDSVTHAYKIAIPVLR